MARRNRQQWQELIEAQLCSGQSAAAFCRQQGVSATYFSSKKRQLGEQTSSRFLKVIPQPKMPEADEIKRGDKSGAAGVARGQLRIIDLELGAGLETNTLTTILDRVLR